MSNTNEKTLKKTQNELLNDTQSFMAAELKAVKDSIEEIKEHCACADRIKLN